MSDARPRRPLPTATLGLYAIGLVVFVATFFPVFLGDVFAYRDAGSWVVPAQAFLRDAWRSGDLPWWNPRQGLGLSLAASPLHGAFYPPYLLGAWIEPAHAVTVLWLLHTLWGAIGMGLTARALGLSAPAAFVTGATWGLSGHVVSSWSVGVLLPAGSWLPWIALAVVRACLSPGQPMRGALGIGLATAASVLVGELFQTVLALLFAAALAPLARADTRALSLPDRVELPPGARVLARVLAGTLGAALLSAPLWLPLSLALPDTARGAALDPADADGWSLHPLRLLELLAAGAMGDPYRDYPGGPWAGDGASDERPLFYGLSLGAPVLLLVAHALAAARGRRERGGLAIGLAALAVLGLALALGRRTPVLAGFKLLVPLFAYQRAPEKYLLLTTAATALLAGLGSQRLLERPGFPWRALAGLATMLALLTGLPLADRASRLLSTISDSALAAWPALIALPGLAVLRWRGHTRAVAPGLFALVAFELARGAMSLLVYEPAALLTQQPPLARAVLADLPEGVPGPRLHRPDAVTAQVNLLASTRDPHRLAQAQLRSLRPALATRWGVGIVPAYDAGESPLVGAFVAAGSARPLSVLALLGVTHVVLPTAPEPPEHLPGLRRVATDPAVPGATAYRVVDTLPRVFAADAVRDDAGGWQALLAADVVSGQTALIDDPSAPTRTPGEDRVPAGAPGSCALVKYTNTRVEADCELQRAAWVVFLEQYAEGWTAVVAGRPAPVVRANRFARAVRAGPGRQRIQLTYVLPGLRLGGLLAAAGAALLFGAAWSSRPSPRSRRAPRQAGDPLAHDVGERVADG